MEESTAQLTTLTVEHFEISRNLRTVRLGNGERKIITHPTDSLTASFRLDVEWTGGKKIGDAYIIEPFYLCVDLRRENTREEEAVEFNVRLTCGADVTNKREYVFFPKGQELQFDYRLYAGVFKKFAGTAEKKFDLKCDLEFRGQLLKATNIPVYVSQSN